MDLQFDLGRWLGTDTEAYEYQLIAVPANRDDFPFAEATTYPLTNLQQGRYGRFENILWPDQQELLFTLVRRPTTATSNQQHALRVYPNPMSKQQSWQWQLRLTAPQPLTASLNNAQGQIYWWKRTYAPADYFAAEERPLPPGIYWLTLQTAAQTFTQKIVVQ